MNQKEKLNERLQQTINELKEITKLKEPILNNWNDDIAKTFNEKYIQIEKEIDTIVKEIENLQKII